MATLVLATTAPPAPSPARESGGGGTERPVLAGPPSAAPPPAILCSAASEHRWWLASDPDLQRLVREFPIGTRVVFRGYHPTIWPRSWRRMAERATWGLRPGDLLEVEGYGASLGFPEALLCRRLSDSVRAMVFFPEVAHLEEQPMAIATTSAGPGDERVEPAPPSPGSPVQEGSEPAPVSRPGEVSAVEEDDPVIVASEESFPASDPPAWVPAHVAAVATR